MCKRRKANKRGVTHIEAPFIWHLGIQGITDKPEGAHIDLGITDTIKLDLLLGYTEGEGAPLSIGSATPYTAARLGFPRYDEKLDCEVVDEIDRYELRGDIFEEEYLCDPYEPQKIQSVEFKLPKGELYTRMYIMVDTNATQKDFEAHVVGVTGSIGCCIIRDETGRVTICDYTYFKEQGYHLKNYDSEVDDE